MPTPDPTGSPGGDPTTPSDQQTGLDGLLPGNETALPCYHVASDEQLCQLVYRVTDSTWLAAASDWLIAKPAHILGLLLIGVAVRWMLRKVIDRLAQRAAEGSVPGVLQRGKARQMFLEASPLATERRRQRAATMASLLKSVTTGVVFAVILIMVIDVLGYNVAPLIASAGILGVALGFGAQSLVKDFLSGIFMILEDQYGVGDVVDVGEATGSVEAVGLRITRLRDVNGTVWYVRNGEILRVGNMSQNWARTVLDVGVGYGEDLTRVRQVLTEEAHALYEDEAFRGQVLEEPEVWGVERMDPDAVIVRVVLKTAPLEQWAIARELRERIKRRFDREGIELPLPQRVIWHRDEASRPPVAADPGAGSERG
ncbi:MAG: mechanosensitive ion channel family protein [Actinomycetota bacterium]|nr:mechanosensitive ion channel family protein [Actinomycetota bacterium]